MPKLNLDRFSGQLLSALRIVTGLCFLEHGTMKLLGFPASPMPQPPLISLMGIAGLLELIGGFLIVIGLFTRPVAFLLAGEMAVAYFTVHLPQGIFPALNKGEAAVLFCFIFLYLSASGPGLLSVDALRDNKQHS
jgi:putative oxidoreductase